MRIGLVLIGRNEGERLLAALSAARGQADRIIYVDSGSTDGSIDAAREAGVEIVQLDRSAPFSAARARNAGAERALDRGEIDYIQFIDGDCAIVPGWTTKAATHLDEHPELALVTGWRSEIHPTASVYNLLCHWEWRRPAGRIAACGGDMMVRAKAFRSVGGFDASVIAAEDDELCQRLHLAGWELERLPQEMTRHDAAMTRFAQWWRRAVRTGHGFAQVGQIHRGYFRTERQRALFYALAVPVAALVGLALWPPLALLPLIAYPVNLLKSVNALRRDGVTEDTGRLGLLVVVSKFPNLIGMARFHARRLRHAPMRLIEYK